MKYPGKRRGGIAGSASLARSGYLGWAISKREAQARLVQSGAGRARRR